MKIAYLTTYDAEQVHSWSGTGYSIMASLRDLGHQVDNIVVPGRSGAFVNFSKLWQRRLGLRHFRHDRCETHLNYVANKAAKGLSLKSYDRVVSPGTVPISNLQTEVPIVIWSDATFLNMVNYYKSFSRLPKSNIAEAKKAEFRAFDKSSKVVFSSEWARNSSITDYDIDQDKSVVIPFGANFPSLIKRDVLLKHLDEKSHSACRLLFVGSDWERKGGEFLLATAKKLLELGVTVQVDIVGCRGVKAVPNYVKFHGFIATGTAEGRSILEELCINAHFLVVPSDAECFGIVYAEASSYGLPAIAKNVGGVSNAVVTGENGVLLDSDVSVNRCAEVIYQLYVNQAEYRALSLRSLDFYDQQLNWDVAASRFEKVLNAV